MDEKSSEDIVVNPEVVPQPASKDEKTWAMAAHLSALLVFIGIPFVNILGPFVIWMMKKEEMPFVEDQAREALNFQISMTIYSIVAFILCLIVVGFVLLFALGIAGLVLVIIAAIKASNGETYRYPMNLRFIK